MSGIVAISPGTYTKQANSPQRPATENEQLYEILFQTFCLTISSQAQSGAAAGTEEVGKVWPQVNR